MMSKLVSSLDVYSATDSDIRAAWKKQLAQIVEPFLECPETVESGRSPIYFSSLVTCGNQIKVNLLPLCSTPLLGLKI